MKNMIIWFLAAMLLSAFVSGAFKSRDEDDIPRPPKISVDKTETRQ